MWTKSNRSRGRGGYHTEQQKMTSTRKASVPLFIAAIALGAAYAPAHAAARSNFDGNWSVLIVTSSGPCDPSYRFGLSIRNGDIFYNGSGPVNLNGRVSGNGSVRVQVSAGAQSANGAGSLSRDHGGGQWRGTGSSGSCTGSWTAQRQWIGVSY